MLSETLNMPEEKFESVVYFTGRSQSKTPMPKNVLWGMDQLIDFLEQFPETQLTDVEVAGVAAVIQTRRLKPGRATDQLHVANLEQRFAEASLSDRAPEDATMPTETVETPPTCLSAKLKW